MKEINFKEDFLRITHFFESLKNNYFKLMIWQKKNGKRFSTNGFVNHILLDHKIFSLSLKNQEAIPSEDGDIFYLYNEETSVLFKSFVKEVEKNEIYLFYPKKMVIIEDELNKDSEREEAMMKMGGTHISLSSFNPALELPLWESKWGDFTYVEKIGTIEGPAKCPVLDFSSGGTSFLFFNKNYFVLNESVFVSHPKIKDKILVGTVSKIQEFDEEKEIYQIFVRL